MSKKANPTAIGVFVVVAAVIAVAGILVLGSGRLFEQSKSYILIFEGDLNGLDVGAPVTSKGVRIGEVEKISIVYDHATDTISTPVIIKIMKRSFVEVNQDPDVPKLDGQNMDLHVERGLRARLETLSLVTGKLRVSLGFHPDKPAVFRAAHTDLDEIPTIPTAIENVMQKVSELPLSDIVIDLRKSMASVATFFESGTLEKTFEELNKTMAEISEVVKSSDLKSAISAMDDTLIKTQELMGEMTRGVKPMQRELMKSLEEFSDAARSAQNLLEYLERHPEALIHGKGNEK